MIGAGEIVPERDRTRQPDEHSTRHPEAVADLIGIGEGQQQMLGGKRVRKRDGGIEVPGGEDPPSAGQGGADDVTAFGPAHRLGQRGPQPFGDPRGADHHRNRDGIGIVFSLRHHFTGHDPGVGGFIHYHQDLTRPRRRIDADPAGHLRLGFGHIRVARPDDAIHAGNRGRSERHGGDGLGAA